MGQDAAEVVESATALRQQSLIQKAWAKAEI